MTDERTGEGVIRRGRFSAGPARDFLSSLSADERIFAADLAVDRAHVLMLAECEIVDAETAGEILAALDDVEVSGHASLPGGEDVHEAIETAVIDRVGPDGGRMHTARSRNDEVATCIRVRLREDLLEAIEATLALREALTAVADAHAETVMAGYTHLQPAQPTTVGHWACSYEGVIRRDTARLFDAYGRVDACPLGAAAFAGTPFEVDRERVAELLGFDAVVENAMDATASRDWLLESTGAIATLATTLSGLAADLILFANRGFVDLADAYASTSSIMPQKKNPDTVELVRATAGDAAGAHQGLLTTLKGLPRAYNRDLQRATPHVWTAVDAVTEATDVAAGAVATADWNDDVMEATAGAGFATATGVADLLAEAGVPFRTAHEVVATAAERWAESGTGESRGSLRRDRQERPTSAEIADAAADVLAEPLERYVDREAVEATLDPTASVASRNSMGGPAPEAVAAQRTTALEVIERDEGRRDDLCERLETAREARRTEVSRYV